MRGRGEMNLLARCDDLAAVEKVEIWSEGTEIILA